MEIVLQLGYFLTAFCKRIKAARSLMILFFFIQSSFRHYYCFSLLICLINKDFPEVHGMLQCCIVLPESYVWIWSNLLAPSSIFFKGGFHFRGITRTSRLWIMMMSLIIVCVCVCSFFLLGNENILKVLRKTCNQVHM